MTVALRQGCPGDSNGWRGETGGLDGAPWTLGLDAGGMQPLKGTQGWQLQETAQLNES